MACASAATWKQASFFNLEVSAADVTEGDEQMVFSVWPGSSMGQGDKQGSNPLVVYVNSCHTDKCTAEDMFPSEEHHNLKAFTRPPEQRNLIFTSRVPYYCNPHESATSTCKYVETHYYMYRRLLGIVGMTWVRRNNNKSSPSPPF